MEGLIAGSHNVSDRLLCRRVPANGKRRVARRTMMAMVPRLSFEMWS